MGSNGVQQHQQGMELLFGDGAQIVHLVYHGHHSGDGGVVLHGLVVLGHLLYGAVNDGHQFGTYALCIAEHILQTPHSVKEPAAAPGAGGTPGNGLIERAHEHLIETESICAHFVYHVVGVDNIASGLGHLFVVFAQYHAVTGALLIGLLGGNHADIIKELMPETGVQQMQRGVLHAAVVPVYRHPIF